MSLPPFIVVKRAFTYISMEELDINTFNNAGDFDWKKV
jgi:hypothetical protein